jgi:hypothetical protein
MILQEQAEEGKEKGVLSEFEFGLGGIGRKFSCCD